MRRGGNRSVSIKMQIQDKVILKKETRLAFQAVFLLIAIASPRILRLNEIQLNNDEAWSLYIGLGSWQEILSWIDVNWPPLNMLFIDLLVELVGFNLLALRYFFLLMFVIGACIFYRVILLEQNRIAALLTVLLYGGIGYLIFASLELRGYATMLFILPVVWYSAQGFRRWNNPKIAIICLAVSASLAMYINYLSVIPLAIFFFSVIWFQPECYQQNIRYLLISGILCLLLMLPLLVNLDSLLEIRNTEAYKREILEPMITAEAEIFRIWFAHGGSYRNNGNWLYVVLLGMGIIGFLWQRRVTRFTTFAIFFGVV